MKSDLRQSMAWLHTWAGVCFGWALFVILLSGSLAVFEGPITEWMQARPSAFWAGLFGEAPEGLLRQRHTYGGQHFVRLHFSFHADLIGIWIVGLVTIALLTAVVSGVITHASLLRDLFTFRPGHGARSWRDAHTALAVLTLPFLVMIAYTGLALFHTTYMPAAVAARYGDDPGAFRRESYSSQASQSDAEPTPRIGLTGHPPIYQSPEGRGESGARVARQTMVVLHLAQFGGAPMRWLYFVSGLVGAGAVASGLTLYVAKRRKRHADSAPSAALAAVERLNVAMVAGLCVASAAYFWANRLVPAETTMLRSTVELSAFVAVWAACLGHALWRGPERAWREQLALAAALCAGLPLLNAASSDLALPATLATGDLSSAAVDGVALVFGVAFGVIAWRLHRARSDTAVLEGASAHAS